MNRNILLKNVFSAAGQTVVQTVVLFLLYRYLIDRLGIERLGIWGVVLATTSVARVGELGLSGSVTKFVSTHRSQGNDRAAREGLQTAAISLAVILALLLPVLYLALVPLLPHLLPAAAVADAGGLGAVFGPGSANQTTLATDGGQFAMALTRYRSAPTSLR